MKQFWRRISVVLKDLIVCFCCGKHTSWILWLQKTQMSVSKNIFQVWYCIVFSLGSLMSVLRVDYFWDGCNSWSEIYFQRPLKKPEVKQQRGNYPPLVCRIMKSEKCWNSQWARSDIMMSVAHYKHFRAGKDHSNNLNLTVNFINVAVRRPTKALICPVSIWNRSFLFLKNALSATVGEQYQIFSYQTSYHLYFILWAYFIGVSWLIV